MLALDGIATVSEVYLNGQRVLASESMFAAHEVDVGEIVRAAGERARDLLPGARPAVEGTPASACPVAHELVSDGNLRFYRTMLLGPGPGFRPRSARDRAVAADPVGAPPGPGARGTEPTATNRGRQRGALGAGGPAASSAVRTSQPECRCSCPPARGRREAQLALTATVGESLAVSGEVAVPDVARWWPHTHGAPRLYEARLIAGDIGFDIGRVGFRTLSAGNDPDRDGIQT